MTTPLGQVTGELQDAREYVTFGTYNNQPVISATQKYTADYSIRFGQDVKSCGLQFPAQSSLRAGYWLRHVGIDTSSPTSTGVFWILKSATRTIFVVWKYTGDGLAIVVDNVVVALASASTAGRLTTTNEWMHLGLTYRSGAGGGISFFVNGVAVLSYASDTLPTDIVAAYGPGAYAPNDLFNGNALVLNSNVSGGFYNWNNHNYCDDFYVDGDISTDTAPPPDRYLFSLASAAGSSAQWTPTGQATNIACVDEAVPNDDTDYVKAEAVDLVDLYNTADITLPADYGIVDVIPIVLAKTMASGPTVKLVASDGVNADLVSAEKTPGTSYGYHWQSMPLAPDGGAWTEAKVNAAQFGVKSAGVYA